MFGVLFSRLRQLNVQLAPLDTSHGTTSEVLAWWTPAMTRGSCDVGAASAANRTCSVRVYVAKRDTVRADHTHRFAGPSFAFSTG